VGSLPIGTYQIQIRDMASIEFTVPGPQSAGAPSVTTEGPRQE